MPAMGSPLGKYSAPAAAIAGIGLIAAYVLALMFSHVLLLDEAALAPLHDLAILAAGAIFGSAVAVNGYKAPVAALHARLDAMGVPSAGQTLPPDGPVSS
jgi:hypothetical protein